VLAELSCRHLFPQPHLRRLDELDPTAQRPRFDIALIFSDLLEGSQLGETLGTLDPFIQTDIFLVCHAANMPDRQLVRNLFLTDLGGVY